MGGARSTGNFCFLFLLVFGIAAISQTIKIEWMYYYREIPGGVRVFLAKVSQKNAESSVVELPSG